LKTTITVIVTLLVAGGAVWGWGKLSSRGGPAKAEPIGVRVEPAEHTDLVEVVTAPGQVQPRTKVSISAKVAARIIELPHKEGEEVSKGSPKADPPKPADVLVKLDAKDLEAALRSTKARYAAQEAGIRVEEAHIAAQKASISAQQVSLDDAARDLKRQKDLLATSDVAQSVVDAAQAKYDGLKAQIESLRQNLAGEEANIFVLKHNLEAAEADVAKAQEDLSNTTILSPIDGTITKLNSEVGEMVVIGITNSPGTTIMEVADLNTMLFVARVDESSIATVKPKQKATVRIPAYADEVFEGIVETVALSNTEDKDMTKYFKAEILLNTHGRRIPSGLTADAEIETKRHENVIAVPSQSVLGRPVDDLPEAVRSRPEVDRSKTLATVVYRVVGDKTVVTPVTVGASNATHTIIKSGLAPGDRVVTGPFKILDTLHNDVPVKDIRAASTSKPATSQPATTQAVAVQK
jgi:HlyD family secretion protein